MPAAPAPTYGAPYWGYEYPQHQQHTPNTWSQSVQHPEHTNTASRVFVPVQEAPAQIGAYETSQRTTIEASNRELGNVYPSHAPIQHHQAPTESSHTQPASPARTDQNTPAPKPKRRQKNASKTASRTCLSQNPTGRVAPNAVRSTRHDLATDAEMAEFYAWTKTSEGRVAYTVMKNPYLSGGEKLLVKTLVEMGFWGVNLELNYNKHRPPGTKERNYRKLHETWGRVHDIPSVAEVMRRREADVVDLTTPASNSPSHDPNDDDDSDLEEHIVSPVAGWQKAKPLKRKSALPDVEPVVLIPDGPEEYLRLAEALRADMPTSYGKSTASDLATNLQQNMAALFKVSSARDLGKALEGNMRGMYGESGKLTLTQLNAFLAARFPQKSAAKRSKVAQKGPHTLSKQLPAPSQSHAESSSTDDLIEGVAARASAESLRDSQSETPRPPRMRLSSSQIEAAAKTANASHSSPPAPTYASSQYRTFATPPTSSQNGTLATPSSRQKTAVAATTTSNAHDSFNATSLQAPNQLHKQSTDALLQPNRQPTLPYVEPVLCKEQADLVELIVSGRNVFYTGSAGCGKSTVLKSFTQRLKEMGKDVRIVAPTGRAALDINGSTTWTFAGWTPNHMKKPIKELEKNAHGRFVNKRLRATDVLVIDEISMVENHYFERLNRILKTARGKPDKPFGGLQLVVTGDFCQLPPVKPFQFCLECGREMFRQMADTVFKCPQHGVFKEEDKWAFRSDAWEKCKFVHVNLTQIHRQSDKVFIDILQKLRIGTSLTATDQDTLMNHPSDTQNAVQLFCTHAEVKRINDSEFNHLTTRKVTYTCLDTFNWNPEHRNLEFKNQRNPVDNSLTALREHRLDPIVDLKEGMLVVLLVNLSLDEGLVNGTQGRIIGFQKQQNDDMPIAGVNLRLKSSSKKGSEPPSVPLTAPVLGGEYAALRESQIRIFITQQAATSPSSSPQWPVVRFDNGVTRTIFADCRVHELGDEEPYSLLMRTQIPLVAAWAMTIHKSQGMTLNRVIVDLAKSFEEGQEYVALSRARSLEGLRIRSLGKNMGGGNAQVRAFLWDKFGIR